MNKLEKIGLIVYILIFLTWIGGLIAIYKLIN